MLLQGSTCFNVRFNNVALGIHPPNEILPIIIQYLTKRERRDENHNALAKLNQT